MLWFVYCCFSLCYCLSLQLAIWIGLINHLIKYNWLRIVAISCTSRGLKVNFIVLSGFRSQNIHTRFSRCERKGFMVFPTSKALVVTALDPSITNSARSITRHELENFQMFSPCTWINVCSNEQFTCLESLDYKHEYIVVTINNYNTHPKFCHLKIS